MKYLIIRGHFASYLVSCEYIITDENEYCIRKGTILAKWRCNNPYATGWNLHTELVDMYLPANIITKIDYTELDIFLQDKLIDLL